MPSVSSRPPSLLLGMLVLLAVPTSAAELRLEPQTVKPGDPVLVTVLGVEEEPSGTVGGRALRFYEIKGGFQAITGLPVELSPGAVEVRVEATVMEDIQDAGGVVQLEASGEVVSPEAGLKDVVLQKQLKLVDPAYRVRELTVAKKFVSPPAKVRRWMKEDRQAFARALAQPFGPLQIQGDFGWPLRGERTAPFGDLRTYNGKKQSQHYGVDLDGKIGDPVEAANEGTVVMVRECYASGNTVILHHGADLYTLYFHLSAFDVQPGDKVKKGQLLGKVGKTGRVTGPHLHWSVKADNLYVDGETLLAIPFAPRPSAPRTSTP